MSQASLFPPASIHWELGMLDILMVAIALSLFALSIGYSFGCERL